MGSLMGSKRLKECVLLLKFSEGRNKDLHVIFLVFASSELIAVFRGWYSSMISKVSRFPGIMR